MSRKIEGKGDVKIEMDVHELASGMYLINVHLEDKSHIVKLIVE